MWCIWFVNNKAYCFTKNCCSWLSVRPPYFHLLGSVTKNVLRANNQNFSFTVFILLPILPPLGLCSPLPHPSNALAIQWVATFVIRVVIIHRAARGGAQWGFDSHRRYGIFVFASTLRTALGSTCFPIRKGRNKSVEVSSTHSFVSVASFFKSEDICNLMR